MAVSRDDILAKALTLREKDRAELAGALIKSLESDHLALRMLGARRSNAGFTTSMRAQ